DRDGHRVQRGRTRRLPSFPRTHWATSPARDLNPTSGVFVDSVARVRSCLRILTSSPCRHMASGTAQHPSDRGHPLDGDQPGAVRVHRIEPAGRGDRTEPPRRGTLSVSGTRIITGEAGRWTFPTTALNGVWHGRHGRAPRQG